MRYVYILRTSIIDAHTFILFKLFNSTVDSVSKWFNKILDDIYCLQQHKYNQRSKTF
jgi:hypothetical protein